MQAPLPPDEQERLRALKQFEILDTAPEQQFDDIALLASHICGTPMAMVSLIDENRQWFKSKVGATASETPRDIAFCAHGILQRGVFVVNDAQADRRFASNPLVTGGARIRFYAGVPLITSGGHALGMLCVNDHVPRDLSLEQKTALQALSRQVVALLELRRSGTELRQTLAQLNRTEHTLHQLRDQRAMILNSVGEGVHGLGLDGQIIFENPAAAAMLGYEIADLIGRPAHGTMHHSRPDGTPYPQEECPIHATLKDGLIRHVTDEVFWRKDGTSIPVEYTSAPLRDEQGAIMGVTVVFADVTTRKRLEARLFQSQKMETVGKLAGGIAHEFNSILTAIIGQSELLLDHLPVRSPLAKEAVQINQAAGRAATLTRQLLAYGRKQFLQPETLDLNRVVAGMEGVFRLLMGGEVDIRIAPGAGLRAVKADAGQIEQVIMNIVINAREAMPNGGKLTLETANVSFDHETAARYPELKAGDYVMLAITDTGAGMSEEVKARLFEPFFSTKAAGQGTGLGLSTCYGIVKQSGGHISVYSEPGRGATFKIYLPQIQLPAGIAVQRPGSQDLPRGTETILLVEDDPALREMGSTLLRRLGYTVWTAANGVEALSLKQQRHVGHIDLVFTDVVMPQMGGKELADRLEAACPHTRILFTSACAEGAIAHQGVLSKGAALLPKPFTPSALANKVREVLGGVKSSANGQ